MSRLILFVFYSLLYNFLIQDSVWEGSEGEEDQQEEAVPEEDPKEEEKNSLSVRVTIIRNAIYHCYYYVSHSAFILFISTLVTWLNTCFSCIVTIVALSKSSHVAYGRSSKWGQSFFVTFCYISPLIHFFTPIVWHLSLTRRKPPVSYMIPQYNEDSFIRKCLANSLHIASDFPFKTRFPLRKDFGYFLCSYISIQNILTIKHLLSMWF